MKRVFSNSSEVAHIWASQSQNEGRCSNMYFEGKVLYSYGRHYPLGVIFVNRKGETAVIINAAGYSVTTAKHIREAADAVSHISGFRVESTAVMQQLCSALSTWTGAPLEYKRAVVALNAHICQQVDRLAGRIATDKVKRKAATLAGWQSDTANYCGRMASIIEFLGGKVDAAARKALESLGGSVEGLKAGAEKAQAAMLRKKAKEAKEREKAQAALIAVALPAWCANEATVTLNGENHSTQYAMNYCERVYMRVIGEGESREVETSRGARFPLSHGLRALPLIRAIVASGEAWHRNGKTIHLGSYQIDSISEGVIVAGCHKLPVSEVERLAASLGV